jgi:hypothetical protein
MVTLLRTGNLVMEQYGSNEKEEFSDKTLVVVTDGIEQGMYHKFYGEKGKGKVLVGEVSAVNDDTSDYRKYL